MSEELTNIELEEFSASAEVVDEALRVTLAGNADHGVLPHLEAFVPKLHAEARRAKVAEVVVDMTQLEFMNSSCFRSFVHWVGWIRNLDPGEQYLLRFVATPARHWQRPSLRALSCFAVNIVQVDEVDLP
jgi:anti-anti-sigma factor